MPGMKLLSKQLERIDEIIEKLENLFPYLRIGSVNVSRYSIIFILTYPPILTQLPDYPNELVYLQYHDDAWDLEVFNDDTCRFSVSETNYNPYSGETLLDHSSLNEFSERTNRLLSKLNESYKFYIEDDTKRKLENER